MSTELTFSPLSEMAKGAIQACNAATGTLGPKGLNAYIDDAMVPKITNDGFTIISKIELNDKLQNMGVKIVKSATARTVDEAGDGTTTTAVLLKATIEEAMKRPENPMIVRASIREALPKVLKAIEKTAKKIDKKDIKSVVMISAEDETLATAISNIINKMGDNPRVDIEDSSDNSTSYEMTDGYEAHVGFMSMDFVTEKTRARCIMQDVGVFVTDKKISTIGDVQPLFKMLGDNAISKIVIVCDDIDNAVLGQFILNKRMGVLSSCVIRAQGDVLKDIEACVGAKRVSDSTGVSFQNITTDCLGYCKKITVDAKRTLFVASDLSKSKQYAIALEKEGREERNQFVRDRIMRRVSQLRGGIAVLRIGGPNFNREYLKDKADDAVKAAKSALEEGVVEGGGMCLYRVGEAMNPKTIGEQILKKILSAPLRTIIENCGLDYTEIVKNMPEGMGYDARKNIYTTMVESGIIDPAKVERVSLINAIHDATDLITSHVSIYEYTKEV